jgi:hypothetical protein
VSSSLGIAQNPETLVLCITSFANYQANFCTSLSACSTFVNGDITAVMKDKGIIAWLTMAPGPQELFDKLLQNQLPRGGASGSGGLFSADSDGL